MILQTEVRKDTLSNLFPGLENKYGTIDLIVGNAVQES
jgi:hypothetical protein